MRDMKNTSLETFEATSRPTKRKVARFGRWTFSRTVMVGAPLIIIAVAVWMKAVPAETRAAWGTSIQQLWPLNRKVQTVFNVATNCTVTS